ncbi:Xanthine dehydrogenase [Nymphon striatum]|nr:Xanthine dehydrogenase [Nymphon striatum]
MTLTFLLNGESVHIQDPDPTVTLLDWLRETRHLTATKEGCNEGDCGACTVMVSDPDSDKALNACILFLPQLAGKHVRTVEGITGPRRPASPRATGDDRPPRLAMRLLHTGFYRLNGHRPPERRHRSRNNSGRKPVPLHWLRTHPARRQSRRNRACSALDDPSSLYEKYSGGTAAGRGAEPQSYHAPETSDDLAALLVQHPDTTLIAGATDVGLWVTKQFRDLGKVAFLNQCRDLQQIDITDDTLTFGAGVTMDRVEQVMTTHYPSYAEMIRRYGSAQVRAAATIGGNIANGSPIGDNPPALIALNAQLHLRHGDKTRTIPLQDFFIDYGKQDRQQGEFVTGVSLPARTPDFRVYKLSKRFDQDISALCGGFVIETNAGKVTSARIAFGGMAGIPKRASAVENALLGQAWTKETVTRAASAFGDDFTPLSDMRASAEYRLQTAQNMLLRYFYEVTALKPAPHDSAALHVTGTARYVDDIPTPADTLHLAFGTSEIACGQITSIDLSSVRAAPGVVAVLTADDLPHANDTDQLHYLGQPVFVVIAQSHLLARRAARLAKISYDKQTPILSIEDALAADSRFEDGPRIYEKGDAETAIAAAPHRISGQIEMGGQEHFYLEGQASLALPQEGGDMVVHCSTQHPTEIQHKVADAIGKPMHAVRTLESQGNALAVACAIAANLTGRPCKMRYDRDDDMMITGKRHDFRISYDVGFDDDGDLSLPVADRAMLHADNAYHLAHARIESHRLRTNTQSATAFRGFGGPQGIVGIERVMDHIAHELDLDPLLVRQVNYYDEMAEGGVAPRPAASPQSISGTMKTQTTPYGMGVTDFILHRMTDALVTSSDYVARRSAIRDWNAKQDVIKRGIALTPVKFGISFTLTHLNQAGALVHVYQDGSKVAQVAADRFGLGIDAVRITETDTGKVPNTSATAASSGADLNGMAVQNACDVLRARMADELARQWHCDATDVVRAVSLSSPGFTKHRMSLGTVSRAMGQPFFYFAYGAAVTEVAVDTLTGENRILRADILHDCGASLNPDLDIGQIEGGYVQGAGWLTMEELVWDDQGALRTHAPSTYKIPGFADQPDVLNVSLWDGANPAKTVYRSKAVGEPPFMHGISALMAISDAISSCGSAYPALDAPATPERILKAIQQVRRV